GVRRRFGGHGLEVISLAQDAKSGSQVIVPFARDGEIAPVVDATGLTLPPPDIEWRRGSRRRYVDRAALAAVPLAGAAVLMLAIAPALGPAAAGLAVLFAGLGALALLRQLYRWWYDAH